MSRRITRRAWAASLSAASAATLVPAANALAQAPQPAPPADQLLQAARDERRRNQETLANIPVDPLAEPAFRFEV